MGTVTKQAWIYLFLIFSHLDFLWIIISFCQMLLLKSELILLNYLCLKQDPKPRKILTTNYYSYCLYILSIFSKVAKVSRLLPMDMVVHGVFRPTLEVASSPGILQPVTTQVSCIAGIAEQIEAQSVLVTSFVHGISPAISRSNHLSLSFWLRISPDRRIHWFQIWVVQGSPFLSQLVVHSFSAAAAAVCPASCALAHSGLIHGFSRQEQWVGCHCLFL